MKKALLLLLLSTIFLSCEDCLSTLETFASSDYALIKLGAIRNNPYSLKNMQKAYSQLKDSIFFSEGANDMVKATHLYVRFLPKNEREYFYLKYVLKLVLFNYPLDRVVEQPGNVYVDVSTNGFSWQYTKVPYDFVFPKEIQYEVLDELYMPMETNEVQAKSSSKIGMDEWHALLHEAIKVSGNNHSEFPANSSKSGWTGGKDPYPIYVSVTAWDDTLKQQLPIKDVQVRLNYFTSWDIAYTSDYGSALFLKYFIYEGSNISVSWENENEWAIRNGTGDIAGAFAYPIPTTSYSSTAINITQGHPSLFHATLHRAAYHFYNNSEGVIAPKYSNAPSEFHYVPEKYPNMGSFSRLIIAAHTSSGISTTYSQLMPNINSTGYYNMSVYKYKNNQLLTTMDWFAITTHEIAHLSHLFNDPLSLTEQDSYLFETWATAVETWFTNQEYQSNGLTNFKWKNNYQDLDSTSYSFKKGYNPLFIDCMDSENQHFSCYYCPFDAVWWYTLEQIQDCLHNMGNQSLQSLDIVKSRLYNNYENDSKAYLDTLFNYYKQARQQ